MNRSAYLVDWMRRDGEWSLQNMDDYSCGGSTDAGIENVVVVYI